MEENTIVTLLDDDNKEVQFDCLMTFNYEGKKYVALLPIDDVKNVNDDEVVILEIVKKGSQEKYIPIENPILLEEVFEEFQDLFDEQFQDEE